MSDLIEFLRARLDEDERAARAAYEEAGDYRVVGSELAELHFVLHKPDRVLREVEALRRIVEIHEPGDDGRCTSCVEYCGDDLYPTEYAEAPCLEVKALAAIWDDHEDYQEEWRA